MEVTWPRFCKNQRLGETSILLCTEIISLCYFYPFRSINYLNKDLHLNDVCDLFYVAKQLSLKVTDNNCSLNMKTNVYRG